MAVVSILQKGMFCSCYLVSCNNFFILQDKAQKTTWVHYPSMHSDHGNRLHWVYFRAQCPSVDTEHDPHIGQWNHRTTFRHHYPSLSLDD
jgi:hypothetical protein